MSSMHDAAGVQIVKAVTEENTSSYTDFLPGKATPFGLAGRAQSSDVSFFFSSRRRHTRFDCDWSSDVCSSDLTHTDGAQNTRAELLQLLGSGTLRYASIAPEAREVRVVGSSAVVTGRSAMRVEASGQVHAFRIRYLAVYRRGARGWELIAWQSTRLPPE